ncbi:kinase-like domain-containing protein [Russula dissimulans]|nr:kinase-like domain-containing protein [Russula dissimulans]
MDSIADCVSFYPSNQLYQNLTQVCRGLMRSVAFLHKLCIAHRDIKPPTTFSSTDFCLKMIDFDLAMQVKNENEEVNDQCGTKCWMAPEIEEKLVYSPIKADWWPTGEVLLFLLESSRKEELLLMTIARKLTVHNPKQRPPILAPFSDVDNVASERKAL